MTLSITTTKHVILSKQELADAIKDYALANGIKGSDVAGKFPKVTLLVDSLEDLFTPEFPEWDALEVEWAE